MSKIHKVIKGDTFWDLSIKYYGVGNKYLNIVEANPQLSGRNKIQGNPAIYPGDSLTIPDETESIINQTEQRKTLETIKANSPDSISIIIDGKSFFYFTEYSLTSNIDTFDTFTFSAPFDETQSIYREAFRPFAYKPVSIYYGNNLIFTGVLISPGSSTSPDKKEISLSGYSKPAILNDCMMPVSSFPLEFNKQTLSQISPRLCAPYGIQSVFIDSAGNLFDKVALDIEKNILSFLIDLAQQRGLLISNNEKGELIYWKSGAGIPIASFKEGDYPFISCSPTFDPQSFFSHITGITQTTETTKSAQSTYINNYLLKRGINRYYNFIAEDCKNSEIASVTKQTAGRMLGACASYELTIQGHIDKSKNLFKKNTLISILAPGAMIYREIVMLIKSLTLSRAENGDTTIFNLVLPGSYTGEIPEVFPWEE